MKIEDHFNNILPVFKEILVTAAFVTITKPAQQNQYISCR